MKLKLQIAILFIGLAWLGKYLHTAVVPNQQIVIAFTTTDISSEKAEDAISQIIENLEAIGVAHIQVNRLNNNQLKIAYFSNDDVAHVQNLLSKDYNLKCIGLENEPLNPLSKNNKSKEFQLNISEIKYASSTGWDFEGTLVFQSNHKSESYYNAKENASAGNLIIQLSNTYKSVAIEASSSVSNRTITISFQIPQVRAGPGLLGIS